MSGVIPYVLVNITGLVLVGGLLVYNKKQTSSLTTGTGMASMYKPFEYRPIQLKSKSEPEEDFSTFRPTSTSFSTNEMATTTNAAAAPGSASASDKGDTGESMSITKKPGKKGKKAAADDHLPLPAIKKDLTQRLTTLFKDNTAFKHASLDISGAETLLKALVHNVSEIDRIVTNILEEFEGDGEEDKGNQYELQMDTITRELVVKKDETSAPKDISPETGIQFIHNSLKEEQKLMDLVQNHNDTRYFSVSYTSTDGTPIIVTFFGIVGKHTPVSNLMGRIPDEGFKKSRVFPVLLVAAYLAFYIERSQKTEQIGNIANIPELALLLVFRESLLYAALGNAPDPDGEKKGISVETWMKTGGLAALPRSLNEWKMRFRINLDFLEKTYPLK